MIVFTLKSKALLSESAYLTVLFYPLLKSESRLRDGEECDSSLRKLALKKQLCP